jgi:hypothetical protein
MEEGFEIIPDRYPQTINSRNGWPLSDREYAFGWLLFGEGLPIHVAEWKASAATMQQVDEWATKQKQALAGFLNMVDWMAGPARWEDPVV